MQNNIESLDRVEVQDNIQKIMRIQRCDTSRDLMEFSNKHSIKKEDIVTILDKQNYFLLVYYGE